MLNIGCHLSITNGFAAMGKEAISIGANTFQFFSRNPRGGKARELDKNDIDQLKTIMKENNFAPILAHAPYTMNLCSAKESVRQFALEMLQDDLQRMQYLPNNYYNFHPGSHVGQGVARGIQQICDALNQALFQEMETTVLLETMAGKGSEIGSKFEEIRKIIDGVEQQDMMGVCLDTCHINDAGYDVTNELDKVLEEFDQIIGLNRLKAIHLNDSMNALASHKDRHQKIGEGFIGWQAMANIINHPALRNLPFYLETPNELAGYKKEIAALRKLYIIN